MGGRAKTFSFKNSKEGRSDNFVSGGNGSEVQAAFKAASEDVMEDETAANEALYERLTQSCRAPKKVSLLEGGSPDSERLSGLEVGGKLKQNA